MMRNTLLTTALLSLILYGCSGEPSQEMQNQITGMENEIVKMERELQAVTGRVESLKSELSDCKNNLQTLVQEKLQEQAEAATEGILEETPASPEPPAAAPENPEHPAKAPE